MAQVYLGNNGVGTAKQMQDNDNKLRADASYRAAELQKANDVIANRKAQGLDITAQENYIKKINGYSPSTVSVQSTPSVTTQAYQSSYTGPNITDMTNKLNQAADLRKASELESLRRANAVAQQGYNKMETQAKQSAYQQRNASDVVNMQNAQKIRQMLADNGLFQGKADDSGANLTMMASSNSDRQGAIGAINLQEANMLNDIGERRTLLNNSTAERELALSQAIEADKLRQLVAMMQYGDQAAMNWDNMQYGRYRDTIADQFSRDQLDWQKIIDAANQTGYFNGTPAWWR